MKKKGIPPWNAHPFPAVPGTGSRRGLLNGADRPTSPGPARSRRAASSLRFWAALFCAALWWEQSQSAFSQVNAAPESGKISADELSRLIEISTRLAQLNGTLRSELEDSRRSSEELSSTLGTSKAELEKLKTELEALRSISNGLASSAENSRKASDELREALKRGESSLLSLEISFESYRAEAERRIDRLDRSRGFWRLAALVASALAIGGWAAFGIGMAFP